MADPKSKPAIPAWQRSQQPQEVQIEEAKGETEATSQDPAGTKESTTNALSTPESSHADQLENMKSFLQDPAVKDAPIEKKRAFFESKGISKDLIDEVLRASEHPAIQLSDFESFKQQQQQQQQQSQAIAAAPPPRPQNPQQQSSAPPIITYPEFLVEAHKPPPLVTLGRIWNTAQIASGLAAIVYGASKYLVTPMTNSLNEARHDFAQHSQSKIHELNERIGKLVSKAPEPNKEKSSDLEDDEDETESSTSDPTELFHRDMGTQTSPPETRRPSTFSLPSSDLAEKKNSPTDYQVTGLEIIKSHLDEMLERSQKLEEPNKERQEKMSNLRHYLDTLMYASPGISVWSSADDVKGADADGGREDAIEELKREIRGVKGVMLSAKRFPGVGMGRVNGAG